jgi:hypothetical protein
MITGWQVHDRVQAGCSVVVVRVVIRCTGRRMQLADAANAISLPVYDHSMPVACLRGSAHYAHCSGSLTAHYLEGKVAYSHKPSVVCLMQVSINAIVRPVVPVGPWNRSLLVMQTLAAVRLKAAQPAVVLHCSAHAAMVATPAVVLMMVAAMSMRWQK